MESKMQRIKNLTALYYSRKEVIDEIISFSKNREVCGRYFDSFGRRPDTLEYPQDFLNMVKKGATSFHSSEELWEDPLKIQTGMNEKQLNELRVGWDLLLDIDSKYIEYSKISAQVIIKALKSHGIKNIGIKFSGSKGFHIIVPWKAFPKEINGVKTSDMFPEYPRIVTKYIMEITKKEIAQKIGNLIFEDSEHKTVMKYIKGEEREKEISKDVAPDIILVSPRHLFRMPYSLHEKTALASIVLNPNEIKNFQPTDANPLKVEVQRFLPDSEEGEARELLLQALDWHKENSEITEEKRDTDYNYQPVKIENLSDKMFPPSIQKILQGVEDGRKRALFVLVNLFRSLGMDKAEVEKRLNDWNKKNSVPLKEGYVQSQVVWSYRNKVVPPPNFDKDYYGGIGVKPTEEEIRYKNPLNYVVKKNSRQKSTKGNKKF